MATASTNASHKSNGPATKLPSDEITLRNDRNNNQPKIRVPSNIPIYLDADSKDFKKRSGSPSSAEVSLALNEKLKLVPSKDGEASSRLVTIRFNASLGSQSIQEREARLLEIIRLSNQQVSRKQWGLSEYMPVIAKELQSFEYIPDDQNFKTIEGLPIWISCRVGGSNIQNNLGPLTCANYFNYRNGIAVTYIFSSALLPHWREIYEEVISFTDLVLIN